MPYCSILECRNASRTKNLANGGISYHRFPQDPFIKEKWIDATGRQNWMPTKISTICSAHFSQTDLLITERGRRFLKNNAVPTLNIYILANVRKRDNANIIDNDCCIVTKKRRLEEHICNQKFETAPGTSKKRAAEYEDNDNVLPMKKKRVAEESKNFTKQDSKWRFGPVVNKILRDDENIQDPISLLGPPGSINDNITLASSTYSSPRKQKLKAKLRWAEGRVQKQRLKIKRLQTQGRRLKRRLINVEQLLKELQEKFSISSENLTSLKNLNVQVQDLVARQVSNVKANVVSRQKYSPALRTFALTLNYYSPKAYEYVRRVFNTSLPHPRTLQKWYSKIGGGPGFTKEVFTAIKRKSDSSTSPLVGTLVLDEMSIRRRIEWDGRQFHGYVDMGTGLEGDHLAEAKEALVFLITAINSDFKVPVGFFLVDGVTGLQRADLVKQCLELAHNAGIKIVAVTFDGCPANVSMAGHLGCCLTDFNVKFDHPVTRDPVVTVLDPCHMIKLIRNSFENYKTFIDADGNKIEWKYLQQLNNLQYTETFHLANKLKDRHINFKNERMKVKLATQLFSFSVAKSIEFCRKDLKIQSFAQSEPTEKFLMIFNNIFDVFNSKNLHQHGFKKALNENNAQNIFDFLSMAFEYINKLKLEDGTPVLKSLRKTGFLGFVNCIEALKQLYVTLIQTKILIYLPFYKLSQDHLELFFCNIRCHGGSNNNPTARQFISAYKKMLVHVELRDTNRGNCSALENISILNCSSAEERINRTSGFSSADEEIYLRENEDSNYYDYEENISEFAHHAIAHISGFIVKKMIESLRCDICAKALIAEKDSDVHKLTLLKDKGGLQYPSKDVIKICTVAESFLKDWDSTNINRDVLVAKILRQFVGSNVFDSISYHQLGEFPASNHVTDLIKAVIMRYLNVRIHHLLKLKLRISKRQLLNKYVLFQGQ